MSDKLTHLDEQGHAHMVDVTEKPASHREAIAEGRVVMNPATLRMIQEGQHAKGDVLAVARIAGIQAAKKTWELIPLCHPLMLSRVSVSLDALSADTLGIRAICRVTGPTGVEMEALTAVSVAALTVYDMCKAVDRDMRIDGICLLEKQGGRSGHYIRETRPSGGAS